MKALVVLLLALAVVGCSDKRPTTPLTPTHLRLPPSGKGGKLRGPPGLPSKVIAELAGADADVRFLRNGPVGMLVARAR